MWEIFLQGHILNTIGMLSQQWDKEKERSSCSMYIHELTKIRWRKKRQNKVGGKKQQTNLLHIWRGTFA
jgi:hypothetical protein